jgi:hypothetical protein
MGVKPGLLTLREEYRLRVLRRIFGLKRGEMRRGWRKLHNDVYSMPSIIRRMMKSRRKRWAGHVRRKGEEE